MMNQNLVKLINEELSKTEIAALINKKFDEKLSSKELEKKIKALSASVLEEFFKILWQRKSFWQDSVKR
jgi:hypothetical protein